MRFDPKAAVSMILLPATWWAVDLLMGICQLGFLWRLEAVRAAPHYRLFCMLDNGTREELAERGFEHPQIVVISGMFKPHRTEFSDREYRKQVRDLGDDYLSTLPRRIAA